MAILSVTNLMWLQATPSAISAISWRWYLVFCCIPVSGAVVVLLWFKDTRNKPLEEIAAMFGDEDMVAVYQRELNADNLAEDCDDEGGKKDLSEPSVETVESV
ncbi:hypothetical protein N7488_003370 [Penicillium malachiteum]|nr:hypothetical protein N7488_003370 [Penicillium malachiteum]